MTTYLGAQGARELIAWLSGDGPSLRIDLPTGATDLPRSLVLRRPAGEPEPTLLDRHVLTWAPHPIAATAVRAVPPTLPSDMVLLTNSTDLLTSLSVPEDAIVVVANEDGVTVRSRGSVSRDEFVDLLVAARPAHVRVLVDGADPALATAAWSPAMRAILTLHEWTFLAVQACAPWLDAASSVLVAATRAVDGGTPRPFTGLFTGFVKSLALEYPTTPVVASLHDAGEAAAILEVAVAELAARQDLLPVVLHTSDGRYTTKVSVVPAEPATTPLTDRSVVLAAGGGRGIGAPILAALAARYRPTIVILGSTALDRYSAADLAVSQDDRAGYIRDLVRGPDRISVAEANARFDRLQEARAVRDNLAELERLCGKGKVGYLRCDLRDGDDVRATLHRVRAEHGDVDLLINIAGTNRASDITTKSLRDFLTVRDLKLRTYLNLKDALAACPPRLWCNFGSFVGFTGQVGETDYASANDFLYTAAGAGSGEFTMGWTLWRDIGLGASPVMRAFLAKSNQYSATTTEEGVAHFLAELTERSAANTVFFGDKERAAITDAAPALLPFRELTTPAGRVDHSRGSSRPLAEAESATRGSTGGHGLREWSTRPTRVVDTAYASGQHGVLERRLSFIDSVTRGDGELVAERVFDLDRDGYLELHRVHDYPTLPGTFVPELAAQAAVCLVPDRVPVVFEDLRLESFLRVYRRDRKESKRIHARLVSTDDTESVVDVRVLGDLIAPNGTVLATDRLHFSVRVRLRDTPTPAPRWEHWDEHGSRPLIDPYHVDGSDVLLREVFKSTTDTRLHPLGRRGRLDLDEAGVRRWFPELIVPSVLLDGLVRVAVLELVEDRWTPVAIPRTVRRIDLYQPHTDASLAASGQAVELYVTPVDLNLEDQKPNNRAIAVASGGDADGEVILQVKDIVGAIVGYVDQHTGGFVDRKSFDAGQR